MRLPQQLQRAMAAEAEAAREARAKVIAAEGEHQASRSLANAAEIITSSPAALQVSSFSPFPHCILQHCIATPLFPRETTISATCEVKAETDPKRRNELARSL